jgi:hypothetical protein
MRKAMLTMLLAAGVLGMTMAFPAKANANWLFARAVALRRLAILRSAALTPFIYRPGLMGSFYLSGRGTISPFTFQSYNGFAYNLPTSYQLINRRNAIISLLASGGFRALAFSPTAGYLARIMTPNFSGFVISPRNGFQTFNVPSQTINLTAPGNIPNFYLAYLQAGFFGP